MCPSSVLLVHSAILGFLPCACFPREFLSFYLLRVPLSLSELMSDMEMMVGTSTGTLNSASELLPSPGHPVSGLAIASMMTLGEEFLDGEDEVVPASMSIVHLVRVCVLEGGMSCLVGVFFFIPFIPFW